MHEKTRQLHSRIDARDEGLNKRIKALEAKVAVFSDATLPPETEEDEQDD